MNAIAVLRWVLLAIVAGSVTVYIVQRNATTATPPTDSSIAAPLADESLADESLADASPTDTSLADKSMAGGARVLVTYFTTDVRCVSCREIERLSRLAVEEGFPEQIASGEVVFRVVNTDRPEHRHFVADYGLTNKTVIVSNQADGKEIAWTNRQDVWLLFHEPAKFFAYVSEPVMAYLGGG